MQSIIALHHRCLGFGFEFKLCANAQCRVKPHNYGADTHMNNRCFRIIYSKVDRQEAIRRSFTLAISMLIAGIVWLNTQQNMDKWGGAPTRRRSCATMCRYTIHNVEQ